MIGFVVPLKSAQVSNSWSVVCELFEDTIQSILRQQSDDFRVFVVCHEIPEVSLQDSRVEFIQVDMSKEEWDVSIKEKPGRERLEIPRYTDFGRKKFVGMLAARDAGASHIMFVDADDFISNKIAGFVSDAGPEPNGWYFESGYEYLAGKFFRPVPKFHLRCGTSHIVTARVFENYSISDLQEIDGMFMAHQAVVEKLHPQGILLEPLPFAGAVYRIGHGENLYASGANMRRWDSGVRVQSAKRFLAYAWKCIRYARIPNDLVDEFALPGFGPHA